MGRRMCGREGGREGYVGGCMDRGIDKWMEEVKEGGWGWMDRCEEGIERWIDG